MILRRLVEAGSNRFPRLAAFRDRQRPATFVGWDDGFNGQRERRKLMKEVTLSIGVDAFVETGTHHGATAAYVRAKFDLPVWTVELNPRSYELCRWRFRDDPHVHVNKGDSRPFLRKLVDELKGRRCIFYLDAHWYDDLPLADELHIIGAAWEEWIVVVDDFRVEDDPKYYFDDYGPGRVLEYSYLPTDLSEVEAFWPAAKGMEESYPWRGCIVLGHGNEVIKALRSCTTLRPAGVGRDR